MRNVHFLLCLAFCLTIYPGCAQTDDIPDREIQMAVAVQAAPEADRAEATIYGYNNDGEVVTLKEGSNNQICVSDDPTRNGFQCVCYHKDLEPFMARGRALRAEGKSSSEIFDIREQEAKAGTLQLPEQPTTLHLLEGSEGRWDEASGAVVDAKYRYVVYIPWATGESTGLPLQPLVPGGPWLMDPGTHRAHIMISVPD